jgi:hypothetical protein
MAADATPPPLPADVRERLEEVRRGLLRLHKALLDAERIEYEGEHGRIETSGRMLQLAAHDPWFAWLHPLLELIVQMDEILDADDATRAPAAAALVEQSKALLKADDQGSAFQRQYHERLQADPAVVMAHAEVVRLFRAPRP